MHSTALSNDPADEDPRVLVADEVGCNVVERNFRDGKSEVGMADYQTNQNAPERPGPTKNQDPSHPPPLWPDEILPK